MSRSSDLRVAVLIKEISRIVWVLSILGSKFKVRIGVSPHAANHGRNGFEKSFKIKAGKRISYEIEIKLIQIDSPQGSLRHRESRMKKRVLSASAPGTLWLKFYSS
jgi:hypothetical protein